MRRFLRRGCVWRKSRRSVDPGVAAAVDGPAVHGPAVHGPQTEEAADSSRTSSNTSSIAAEAARPPAFLDILVVACLLALCTVGAWLAYDIAHDAEQKAYAVQFDALVRSLQSDARRQVDGRLVAAQTGAMMLSLFPSLGEGLGTNVQYFMSIAAQLRHLSNSSFAQWVLVVDDHDRERFEGNARLAATELNYTQRLIGNLTGVKGYHPGQQIPVMGRQPRYVPMWASSPRTAETDMRILGDWLTLPYTATLQRVIAEGRVLMTPTCVTPTFHWAPDVRMDSPGVAVVALSWAFVNGHLREDPVGGSVDPLNVTSSLPPSPANGDALFILGFQWESLIAQTLPSRPVDGLEVVLQPPAGPAVTFAVAKGNKVEIVGSGDLHDRRGKPKHRAFPLLAGQDVWLVDVYGTAALKKKFVTQGARSISYVVAFLALACIIIRVVYDVVVRQRMRRLLVIAHRNQERFFEAQAQLLASRQSDRAKDQFVSMVSHEIRTPLNAVAGAIALLRESGTTPEQDDLLDIASAGSAQVVLVITDILSQAALQSGTFSINDQPMRLRKDVVEPTWRMIQMGISKRLSFVLDVNDDVPEHIMGDASRFSQILANLLHNATKFTYVGCIRLAVSTSPAPAQSTEDDATPEESVGAQLLVFAVSDTGIGLESKDLDRIFAPFVQAEGQFTTRTHGGTGLGLTICLRLARAMGGDIKPHSAGPGQGSTFTFTVPLRLAESAADGEESGGGEALEAADPVGQPFMPTTPSTLCLLGKEVMPQSFGEPAPRILLVDDDRLSITVMKKILSSRGAVVTVATDGAEAVDLFKVDDASLDLILMDVRMPRMDGKTAAREILRIQAAERRELVPIIGLTASAQEEDILQCLDAGMCAHITKPITANDMAQISRVIASCRRKRERAQQEGAESSLPSSSSFEVTPRNSFDYESPTSPADEAVEPPQPGPETPQAVAETGAPHPPSPGALRSISSTCSSLPQRPPSASSSASSSHSTPPSPVTPHQAPTSPRRFLDSSKPSPDRAKAVKHFTGVPPRILVVEDDRMSQIVMRRLLNTMGAGEVVVAENGVIGVEAFQTGGVFDLVLMDLHMPVMDGLTATRLILEGQHSKGWHGTPILALTASVSDLEKSRCEASGMAGHIGKPFQLDHLAVLQQAIDTSRYWARPLA